LLEIGDEVFARLHVGNSRKGHSVAAKSPALRIGKIAVEQFRGPRYVRTPHRRRVEKIFRSRLSAEQAVQARPGSVLAWFERVTGSALLEDCLALGSFLGLR